MRVVVPIQITDLNLTSSTISEPDTGEVVYPGASTSFTGERFILTSTHRVYEVVAVPSTADDPETGIGAEPPTWVDVGPTNKYAMFDSVNSTQSEEDNQLIIETELGVKSDSIAGFNIDNVNLINVTVNDPIDGEVYNTDVSMDDNSSIVDYWEWYFNPIVKLREFALLDLPDYADATVKLTADGGEIKFGNVIVGNKVTLGVTTFDSGLQILDFGKKETDSFGNTVVTPGRTSKLVDFEVVI
ncbi:MAG TPA: hypothetical protein EYN67_05010, partial [Flavobacteriales bacterium]|nr:hypothetical protein [Flavobacteriales bacterium]